MDKHNTIATFPKSTVLIACEWVAKLDQGDLSALDSKQLDEWLKSDPINRVALAEQLQQWSEMDVLSELTHLELQNDPQSAFEWFKKPFQWLVSPTRSYAAALSFVMLLAVISWVGVSQFNNSQRDLEWVINTAVGERKTESLPDGSVVQVNTVSSAQITYTRDARRVVLKSGEAFFDVAPEKERPFVVYAADTSIRAVGTAFAVHNDNGSISVSVTEGSVEFISAGKSRIIAASKEGVDPLAINADGNVAKYADQQTFVDTQPVEEIARRLSWQDGMLEFRGEPLEYVVQQLGRYTDAQIVIMDDDIKDVRLGGYFKIGDIDGLASTLALGFNIQVDVVSNSLIHISRGKTN